MPQLKGLGALTALVPEPGPRRVYALSILVNSFGFGLILPAMALYGIRVVHLTGAQVGLGMTIAAAISLVTVIATSSAVSAGTAGRNLINLRLGMLLEVASAAGGIAAGITVAHLSDITLERGFAGGIISCLEKAGHKRNRLIALDCQQRSETLTQHLRVLAGNQHAKPQNGHRHLTQLSQRSHRLHTYALVLVDERFKKQDEQFLVLQPIAGHQRVGTGGAQGSGRI